ncbi:MAG TPA: peptidoglycan-binding protein [Parvibaculum sp.]
MRSGVPWSVKGIEPEAREAAKQAAHRAGVTLGAWLNQIILDAGTDEVGRPAGAGPSASYEQPSFAQAPYAPQPAIAQAQIDLAPVADAVRDVVQRVESSERRTLDLTRRLEQTVSQLAQRLERSEHQMENAVAEPRLPDPLERKIAQLAERLEEAERTRGSIGGRREEKAQIQSLEKAMNAVVDHLDTAEKRTEESLSEIRRTLSDIAGRVEKHEEEEEREEALARTRATESLLQTLAGRLEKMETSVSTVGPQAVESALKAIAEKTDADQHKQTILHLQRSLSDITGRLERAEQRNDETLKTFEQTVSSIARRLEELDTPRENPFQAHLDEIAERLHQTENMTLQTAQTIERAIEGMSGNLNATEMRSRETIESLHVMLERMTDRLGRIEREAKATRTSLGMGTPGGMLAPQIGVGGAGNGFVPGGQAFPIPNFDAPPMGHLGTAGAFGGAADFRSPIAHEPDLPPVHTDHSMDAPPPPFAPDSENDGRREPTLDIRARQLQADEDEAEAEISNPTLDTAVAANDFMAAARRAAQAAAQNARGGPQAGPGASPYPDTTGRFTAVEADRGKRTKVIYGAIAAALVVAVAIGAMRILNSQPVVISPVADNAAAPEKSTDKTPGPGDMAASTETTPAPVGVANPALVPGTVDQSHPEANPEDAGAPAAANKTPASTPSASAESGSPTLPAPAPAKPEAAAKAEKPAPARKPASTMTMPQRESGPTLTPVPAKPVASAPLDKAAGQMPAGERALRNAATAGNPAAQYEVGQRYANGEGMAQDLSQAAYWYNQAADQGLAIAQYRLATLFEKGRGVPQDDGKARSWYEKAATQGNVKAMHNLAVIYAEGRGTRQDFTTASRWFSEAADLGLGDSQYNLAVLQERGLGVKQDLVSAYKWLSIAAKGGDKGAAQKRDELAAKLDAATLAQAKVAAETWVPKRPDPVANGDLSSMGNWGRMDPDVTGSINTNAGAEAVNDLSRAQAMLMKLGYDPGSSDGLMGPRTRDAILAYQRAAGLDQTGSVSAVLLKSLELATH